MYSTLVGCTLSPYMSNHNLLLVEDDASLGESLQERLSQEGYTVSWVTTRAEALRISKEDRFDCAVVDIGLPDGSGFEVAREITQSSTTPVLFLTAMNSAEYRLEAFELGVVDYIPKPFHLKELLLRVRRILGEQQSRTFGPITIFPQSHMIKVQNAPEVTMGERDFELLKFLLDESPKILSREIIMQKVFRADDSTTPRVVDNAIMRIRSALGPYGDTSIRSVRGQGYQWIQN